jgi:uncharacterized membrane protein
MVLAVQDDAWTESCRFMGLDVLALCGATLASARASSSAVNGALPQHHLGLRPQAEPAQ